MPTSGSYNFDIFEENKYFSEKYGPDASFEHLTPASVDKIKEIEKKLETRDILSSREMGKMHYPRIYVSKKYDDLWNISRMRSMTLAADVLPYFPMMLCRVLSKGTQQYSFDNKIVNAFGQGKISSRSSTTSFRDRKKRINSGEDRGRGYLVIRPDRMEHYFDEDVIIDAYECGIEIDALKSMCKDDEYVEGVVEQIDSYY